MSTRKARQLAVRVAETHADLADALVPGTTGGHAERVSGGGRGDDRPAPANLQVIEHRHQLLAGLRYWLARTEQPPWAPAPTGCGTNPALAAQTLCERLDRMSDDDVTELSDNLGAWLHRARVLTDTPALRGTIPLGACPNRDELDTADAVWTCPGTVHAMLPMDRRAPVYVRCHECGTRWEVAELPQAADQLVSVHVAAELAGVSVRTVQRRTPTRDSGLVRLGDALTGAQ